MMMMRGISCRRRNLLLLPIMLLIFSQAIGVPCRLPSRQAFISAIIPKEHDSQAQQPHHSSPFSITTSISKKMMISTLPPSPLTTFWGHSASGRRKSLLLYQRGPFSEEEDHQQQQQKKDLKVKKEEEEEEEIASGLTTTSSTSTTSTSSAYIDLLRPHNIIPSMLLVVMGSWVATHDVRNALDPIVGLTAIISALVAVGSCVLNDWFDLRVDAINHPERILVKGQVPPSVALGIAMCCLGAAFLGALAVPSMTLRYIIRTAVVAVTLYTPIFKPIPFVKNAIVASTTAASLALGGLASGASVHSVIIPASLVFLGIYHREILMDIDDMEGDAQCQIMTLPRLLGKQGALAAAASLFSIGTALCAYYVHTSSSSFVLGWASALAVWVAGAVTCSYDYNVAKRGFRHEDISKVIEITPPMMMMMVVLMAINGGGGEAFLGA